MAYARFSNKKSQVYVWGNGEKLFCTACRLTPRDDWYDEWTTSDPNAMLRHLQEHRQHSQYVPWFATRRLKREIRQGLWK